MTKDYGADVYFADVGSAARVVREGHYNVHCICPNLQPGDASRLSAIKRVAGGQDVVCTHRLQECTCGPFDALLFTHSAYYFTNSELMDAIEATRHKVAYVVGHLFPEAFGQFAYGEGQYEYSWGVGGVHVVTKALGNTHSYTHPPLLWDFNRCVGDARRSIDVEIIAKSLDTYLFRLELTERPVSMPSSMSWVDQVVDPQHQGPITIPGHDLITKASRAANSALEIEVDHLFGFGPIVYTISERGWIYVPRGAVVEAAQRVAYKDRNPASFQDVAHVVRNAVSVSRLPESRKLPAVTLGTALAFTMNVQNEIDVMHTITGRFSAKWKTLTGLIGLVPVSAWSLSCLLFTGAIMVIIATSTLAIPYDHHIIGFVSLASTILILLTICCGMWCKRRYEASVAETWSTTLFVEGRATHSLPAPTRLARSLFPANNNLVEPLLPPEGVQFEVGTDPNPPRHPGSVAPAIRAGGVIFSTAVPSVVGDTQEAEIVALTHRTLREATSVMPTALGRYCIWGDTPAGRALLSIKINRTPEEFEKWVDQPKFTLPIRERFRKLRKQYDGKWVSRKVYRSFVKIEKNKTHTLAGAPKMKPRLIQGPPDEVKAILGPIIALIYRAVRAVWDGGQSQVLYCSGMTPDEIGAKLDAFAEANGGWEDMIGYWSDFRAYDSTVENELQNPVKDLYRSMGMTDVERHWLDLTRGGVTKHGVKYDLGDKEVMQADGTVRTEKRVQINSGEMDTNLKGTIVNAQAHTSGLPDIPYLMLVCGDDMFMLSTRRDFTVSVRDSMVQHIQELGLDAEWGCSTNRADWEFCSKLFWWGERDGRVQTVLAPKVGRLLSRVGWNLTKPGAENFRATLLGLKDDVYHVPLLNKYVEVCLEKTKGMKAVGRPDWEELRHVSRRYYPHPLNMAILQDRYGLTDQHLAEFRDLLGRLIGGVEPNLVTYPWIGEMVKRDEA